jgi:AcrR family transcriptional regulator
MPPEIPTSSTAQPASLSPADHAALTDIALNVFRWRGYDVTTLDHIAEAAGVTPREYAEYFATKDAVIMALVEQVLRAGIDPLARLAPNTDPLDALFIVHTRTLTAIGGGVGIMTRERLGALADVLAGQPRLRDQIKGLRRRVLTAPLAERTNLGPDDRRMRHAFTMWAAIVTGSYNTLGEADRYFSRAGVGPSGDGRVPGVMVQRLSETFVQVTGREPPLQAIDLTSAP